jgi:2-polyprenyl-6-methoxyphenol hydroxylase-like FAD-dependent oxidoreductase
MTTHHDTLEDLPIAIVGGGLAGLTFSVGRSRFGIKHRIYESAKAFSEVGAGIA